MVSVYGRTDYLTPYGVGVRDYSHVEDLWPMPMSKRLTIPSTGRFGYLELRLWPWI